MFRALLVRAVPLLRALNACNLANPLEPELVCSGDGGISTYTCSLRFKVSDSDVLIASERGVEPIALMVAGAGWLGAGWLVVVGERKANAFSRALRVGVHVRTLHRHGQIFAFNDDGERSAMSHADHTRDPW